MRRHIFVKSRLCGGLSTRPDEWLQSDERVVEPEVAVVT